MGAGSQRSGLRGTVLLVEDEPSISESLALLLELEGYQVRAASNGRQALERLRAERPDVVLTDYMMPVMDGLHLARAIKTDDATRDIPVLLMSAALPDGVREESLADRFLPKPLDLSLLLEEIAGLVQCSRGDD